MGEFTISLVPSPFDLGVEEWRRKCVEAFAGQCSEPQIWIVQPVEDDSEDFFTEIDNHGALVPVYVVGCSSSPYHSTEWTSLHWLFVARTSSIKSTPLEPNRQGITIEVKESN